LLLRTQNLNKAGNTSKYDIFLRNLPSRTATRTSWLRGIEWNLRLGALDGVYDYLFGWSAAETVRGRMHKGTVNARRRGEQAERNPVLKKNVINLSVL
jgi:hypothetical protein